MKSPDVSRRGFVKACGAVAALAAASSGRMAPPAFALEAPPRLKLVDKSGKPIKASALEPHANYIFLYPHVSTPCLLLRLGGPTARNVERTDRDAARYVWPGGVGKDGTVVAYSAICAHALSYDNTKTSFLTYSEARTQLTEHERAITCCAHASVYDPANGAEVVSGPAEFPLAAVELEHNAATDELTAVGMIGTVLFDDFFKTFRADLNAEYGRGAYRATLEGQTIVVPIAEYSAAVIQC